MISDWQIESLSTTLSLFMLILAVSAAISIAIAAVSFWSLSKRESSGAPVPSIKGRSPKFRELAVQGFLVGLIGGLAGHLGGASREGAVGDILPAILALVGGYSAYLLGEKRAGSVEFYNNGFCFLVAFFLLFNLSAVLRQSNESFDFCKAVYSNGDLASGEAKVTRDETWGTYCKAVFAEWTKPPQD